MSQAPEGVSSGVQRRQNRDIRRMAKFIAEKEFRRLGSWADGRVEKYLESAKPTDERLARNKQPSNAWKAKKEAATTQAVEPAEPNPAKYQSKQSTALKDDPLYNVTQGSQAKKVRSQNLDHS